MDINFENGIKPYIKDISKHTINLAIETWQKFGELPPIIAVMNSKTMESDCLMVEIADSYDSLTEEQKDKTKEKIDFSVRQAARKLKADNVLSIMSAWSVDIEDQEEFYKGCDEGKWSRIYEYPKKIQILTIILENRDGNWVSVVKTDGKNITSKNIEIKKGNIQGLFSNYIMKNIN